jgi:hypothetical protein
MESSDIYLSIRDWLHPRKPISATRRSRGCAIEVGLLEGRLLLSSGLIAPFLSLPVDGPHAAQIESVGLSGTQEVAQARTSHINSTIPIVSASAHPSSLWPPNHKFVPVTVTGHVFDASGAVRQAVSYHVVDEYGQVQPSGTARVRANGNYSFVIRLQSSRLGQDKDGRLYTIVVSATNQSGATGSAMTFVVVPHDQGVHGGNGNGGGNGNHGHGDGNHGHGNGNHGHGNGHGHG